MKDKLRNKSFWMSLIGAVLVFLQTMGFTFDIPAVNEIVSAGLAVLVVMGIISGDDGNKGGDGADAPPQDGEESASLKENDGEKPE